MHKQSLIIIACFILTACQSAPEGPRTEPPAIPVLAVNPSVQDVPIYIESIGTLQPSIFMEIKPQVNGTLTDVLVKEGQWVHKGTPLFKIDTKPYAIKAQEAQAQIALDRTSLHAAQKKLERYKMLADKDILSKTEWDAIETEEARAMASLDADEARLNAAKLDLERCILTSPTEGRVGKLDAHPGLLVANSQAAPLATVSKMDPLIVEFSVTEKEFPKLKNQNAIFEIQPLCSEQKCSEGHMTFLDNHFDAKSGLLLIRGSVPNPQHELRPGQSVRVLVPVAVESQARLIPQKAVKYNQEGPYVYIVQPDQTVGFRQVVLGDEHGQDVIIREGLEPTDYIITDGHLRLSPGLKVEIKS